MSWSASNGATYYDIGVRDVASGSLVVSTTTSPSYTASLASRQGIPVERGGRQHCGAFIIHHSVVFHDAGGNPDSFYQQRIADINARIEQQSNAHHQW